MDTLTTVRYIEANKLMSALCLRSCYNREHRCDNDSAANEDLKVVEMIKEMPTIDAVPVVRCKDCKHSLDICDSNFVGCGLWCRVSGVDGFCHMGAKMDGGATDGRSD